MSNNMIIMNDEEMKVMKIMKILMKIMKKK